MAREWNSKQVGRAPFFFDTACDVMRLVDYLETRDDVDAGRIGVYGNSKGGVEAYLTAAADTRIAVVVPCIGMQSFRWAFAGGRSNLYQAQSYDKLPRLSDRRFPGTMREDCDGVIGFRSSNQTQNPLFPSCTPRTVSGISLTSCEIMRAFDQG